MPCFRHAAHSAVVRTHLRPPALGDLLDSVRAAGHHDDALLLPPVDQWPRRNIISRMRWARTQVELMPNDTTTAANLQASMY